MRGLSLRWAAHLALPLAAVLLASGLGAAMPLLVYNAPSQSATGVDVGAPIRVSQVWLDTGASGQQPAAVLGPGRARSTERAPNPAASDGAGATGIRGAAVVALQGDGSNAVGQASRPEVRNSEGATSEPSAGPAPPDPAEAEPGSGKPGSEPSTGPAPSPPVDEDTEEGEEPAGEVILCHKPGSKKPKTILVGENVAAEHLAHGDTIGACP